MKAVRRGGSAPEHVAVPDIAVPETGPGEVLIAVVASSINPFDVYLVTGYEAPRDLPHAPGRDLARVVVGGPPELLAAWRGAGTIIGVVADQREIPAVREAVATSVGTGRRYDIRADAVVLDQLPEGFSTGALRPSPVAATFPLDAATDAYTLAASHPPGKVVLLP